MFIFGLLTGITLCIFVLLADVWLWKTRKRAEIERKINECISPNKAVVIVPKTVRQQSAEKTLKENEKNGLPTPIEDLFI